MSACTGLCKVSDRLIESNRRNAQKSTGPRTAEGKAASSRNAVKHGIFADHMLIPGEDDEQFRQHKDGMLRSFDPRDPLEQQLVEQVVWMFWRIKRIRQAEQELYRRAMKDGQSIGVALLDLMESPKGTLERLHQYERRIESTMHRCINQLRAKRKENIRGLLGEWTGDLLEQCKPEREGQGVAERGTGFQPVPEASESGADAASEPSTRVENPCHEQGHNEVRKTNPNRLEDQDHSELTGGDGENDAGAGNGRPQSEYFLVSSGSPWLQMQGRR
ncbi:MAG TPA: hypothetical protein VH518_11475 [Tepidisphaeraceae bacterium]